LGARLSGAEVDLGGSALFPNRDGSGERAMPPPQKCFGFFGLGMVHFACILTHD